MTLRSAIFWIITQCVVVIPYRRFGTTYRSHLPGSRIPKMLYSRLPLFITNLNNVANFG